MSVRVSSRLDVGAIEKYGKSVSTRASDRAAENVKRMARGNITRARRNHTREMWEGVQLGNRFGNQHMSGRAVVATAPHSKYQEFGTRAHGPKRAKFLRFQIRGRGPWIYAKWVRGVKGIHFMRNAARSVTVNDYLPGGRNFR